MSDAASIRIRRLAERDVAAVVDICNASIGRGESTHGPGPVTAEQLRPALFDAPPRFESYGCEDAHGTLVGWGALMRHTERPIYDAIAELVVFVSREHRRRGIGQALARHALRRASELRFRSLLLMLQPEPAHPLAWAVRRLGFRSVGWLSGVVPAGPEWRDLLVFQKSLGSPGSVLE